MSGDGLVSVVMPVWNGAAFLGEAIESVLAQAHRPLEIVVVDDGSTDGSGGIAARFGNLVRCHRQENRGAAAARNRGVALARGPSIAFLDADDLYEPDKLAEQIPRLSAYPDRDVVIGARQYERLVADEGDRDPRPRFEPMHDEHLSLQLGCGLFRRRVFERVGAFDETLRITDDWDWFLRARECGVGLLLHRDLVLRQRIHRSNITRQRDLALKEEMLVLKRSLDRRRRRGGGAMVLPPLSSFFELESRDEGHP
jgi:glycosyltransferase involved in cell wall biosynthesis